MFASRKLPSTRGSTVPSGTTSADVVESLSPFTAPVELRRYRRWSVDLQSILTIAERDHDCDIYDLSPGGARIQLIGADALSLGTRVRFDLPSFSTIPSEIRYNMSGFLGLMFLLEEAEEVALARHMVALKPPRRTRRLAISSVASLSVHGKESACTVENISQIGARLLIDDARHIIKGDEAELHLVGQDPVPAVVRRVHEGQVGLMFLKEIDLEARSSGQQTAKQSG